MKFSEAMKLMEEGKKVRIKSWNRGCFIYINDDGFVLDEHRDAFEGYPILGEWEEYIEPTYNTKIDELDLYNYKFDNLGTMVIDTANKLNEVIRKLNKENNNE